MNLNVLYICQGNLFITGKANYMDENKLLCYLISLIKDSWKLV